MNGEEKKAHANTWLIVVLVVVGIVFGYLALLNGRYLTTNHRESVVVFDKWAGEYVTPQTHKR